MHQLEYVHSFFFSSPFFFYGDVDLWFNSKICGFSGVLSAFTVVVKQANPEQDIRVLFSLSLRAKYIPSCLFAISFILTLLGFSSSFTLFGITNAWIYLRFFQKRVDGSKGDLSENFSFASFFPESLQPPARVFGTIVYNILKLGRCCGNGSNANKLVTVTSTESLELSADAERRRQRALKALDQRIQQLKQPSGELPANPEEIV